MNSFTPRRYPAGVKRMLIGVYDRSLLRPVAEVLGRLGAQHVLVVHAADGLDEISLAGPTFVAEWRDGAASEWTLDPEAFGVETRSLDGLEVDGAEASLALIRSALGPASGRDDAGRKAADIVALNAGAALYVAGVVDALPAGVALARDVIDSGEALARLEALAQLSQSL